MISVAIYDVSTDSENGLSALVARFFTSKNIPFIITKYQNGEELLKSLKTEQLYDIAFLDILLPDLFFTYHISRNPSGKYVLVFSANGDRRRDVPAYAFDYFEVPFEWDTIYAELDKIVIHLKGRRQYITLKIKGAQHKFPVSKITYIESSKHYLFFHLSNDSCIKTYAKLDQYEMLLSGNSNFLRCHQSFIVNMDFVVQLCGHDFITESGTHIPIRKTGISSYKDKYIAYKLIKMENN